MISLRIQLIEFLLDILGISVNQLGLLKALCLYAVIEELFKALLILVDYYF